VKAWLQGLWRSLFVYLGLVAIGAMFQTFGVEDGPFSWALKPSGAIALFVVIVVFVPLIYMLGEKRRNRTGPEDEDKQD
jgi:uncharacterized membrane protein YhaH (DUF805 family)